MHKEKLRKPERWLLAGTGMILSGVVLALLFPIVSFGVAAEELPTMTTSVNTNLTTLVRSSIAVALSSKVDLDITPKANGAFSVGMANMQVTTNNTTGYAVYMQTADNTSKLMATNPHVEASIGPVSGTMSAGDYSTNLNKWGYAVGSTSSSLEYKAVPQAGGEAILRTEGVSREDSYDLSFAVAVGPDLPAGLYTSQLLVSVVTNPIEVRSLNDITYMQDMTSEICAITFEGESKQLVDSRDGKSYWVAKLKDGNCWMTQNLALDIALDDGGNAAALSESGQKVTLDETNSDMRGRWGQNSDYPPSVTQTTVERESNIWGVKSWHLSGGYFYQYNAAIAGNADNIPSGDTASPYSICPVNWTLPLGMVYETRTRSFAQLFKAYGINIAGGEDVGNKLFSEPLNFEAAGLVNTDNGTYWNPGNSGTLWGSNRYNDTAIRMQFSHGGYIYVNWVKPSLGSSVRCVAR